MSQVGAFWSVVLLTSDPIESVISFSVKCWVGQLQSMFTCSGIKHNEFSETYSQVNIDLVTDL